MEQDIQMYLSELAEIYWRKFEAYGRTEDQDKYHAIYDTRNQINKHFKTIEKENEIRNLKLELIKLKLQTLKLII